ncbi:hypothetical protein BDV93DRAFT_514489 [Ceratobasidium sp. AG-I]|nr:hypothetical protein BDV93DRAFT_514489 [Ceratobasidium sp. AG-I]
MAFVPTSEVTELSGSEVVAWVGGLDVGSLVAPTALIREPILLGTHTELLRSLYSIRMTGSHIDQRVSELCEQHRLAMSLFMAAFPSHWYPGDGPCHAAPAINWGDVFREFCVPKPGTEGETELVYLHLGRDSDILKVPSNERSLNASEIEAELRSLLEPRLAKLGSWYLDGVQLFGNEGLLEDLREAVEGVNTKFSPAWLLRIDSRKRMLVLVKDSKKSIVHVLSCTGAETNDSSTLKDLHLTQTHKRTLQRWKNIKAFQPWLDQLDWNQ